jgi:ABC-type Fe3+/spermidine/putrescine transport system ATPase subunit
MLKLNDIQKSFGKDTVIQSAEFSVSRGKTLSVLGPSGCGKTTLLKIIAGLETADQGTIFLEESNISNISPQNRNIVYIHQEAYLYPHLSAFDNIAFGLKARKLHRQQIQQEVNQMLERLGLSNHAKKKPHELSGGQKQRVNFGRALIVKPKVLLLDEPFSNLDSGIKMEVQELYDSLRKEFGITSILVTHDLKEALLLGDLFATMTSGRIEVHSSRETFIEDEKTGVKREIEFWNKINNEKHVDKK